MGRDDLGFREPFDVDRLNRVPTLSEYATAKKEMEVEDDNGIIVGVDLADGDDETVCLVIDKDSMASIYWYSIPSKEKRKIKVGDEHTSFSRTNNK